MPIGPGRFRDLAAVAAVLAAAAGSLAAGGTADGASDACSARGSVVRLDGRHVRVLTVRNAAGLDFYACYKDAVESGQERVDPLVEADLDDFGFLPPALAASGRSVAFGLDARRPEGEGAGRITTVIVDRYLREGKGARGRHAGWYSVHSTRAGLTRESKVGSMVVRPNGAVAWISCPMRGRPSNSRAPTCVRPGYENAVFRTRSRDLELDSNHRELLDRGRGIDPGSLRRRGGRIFWTKEGRQRSAALR